MFCIGCMGTDAAVYLIETARDFTHELKMWNLIFTNGYGMGSER